MEKIKLYLIHSILFLIYSQRGIRARSSWEALSRRYGSYEVIAHKPSSLKMRAVFSIFMLAPCSA